MTNATNTPSIKIILERIKNEERGEWTIWTIDLSANMAEFCLDGMMNSKVSEYKLIKVATELTLYTEFPDYKELLKLQKFIKDNESVYTEIIQASKVVKANTMDEFISNILMTVNK